MEDKVNMPWKFFLMLALAIGFSTNVSADTEYVGTVLSVAARGVDVERLYIKAIPDGATVSPNPANCPGGWAGAAWITDGSSARYAGAIALTAKAANMKVRFAISGNSCYIDHPVMTWILFAQ